MCRDSIAMEAGIFSKVTGSRRVLEESMSYVRIRSLICMPTLICLLEKQIHLFQRIYEDGKNADLDPYFVLRNIVRNNPFLETKVDLQPKQLLY